MYRAWEERPIERYLERINLIGEKHRSISVFLNKKKYDRFSLSYHPSKEVWAEAFSPETLPPYDNQRENRKLLFVNPTVTAVAQS